ncbi:hypothetical protein P22_1483 [Propionispora sp. 2/2-37]|uniref:CYTH domain-containing protein n=1 Tax=Propionispora sp. 2/2-37 TaxID=1677858 RepID=UPI0006BB950C|nr:CYTH domain-containing protein [Propionispora sp. 2/2-37]CUH95412.1 hypothetical protein P22_1483 [Propionispora sp. 2/2-37]
MAEHTELELKLALNDRAVFDRIFSSAYIRQLSGGQHPHVDTLSAFYFDTVDGKLRDRGLTYRIRRENGHYVATVKGGGLSSGGLHRRLEWNVPVSDSVTPNIAFFDHTEIGPVLRQTAENDDRLVPLFSMTFERHTLLLHGDNETVIELAADEGEMTAGGKKEPILELELELKSGHPAAVLQMGAELIRQFPLIVEPRSKYYRALLLAGLAEPGELWLLPGSQLQNKLLQHSYELLDVCSVFSYRSGRDIKPEMAMLLELWAKLL